MPAIGASARLDSIDLKFHQKGENLEAVGLVENGSNIIESIRTRRLLSGNQEVCLMV